MLEKRGFLTIFILIVQTKCNDILKKNTSNVKDILLYYSVVVWFDSQTFIQIFINEMFFRQYKWDLSDYM